MRAWTPYELGLLREMAVAGDGEEAIAIHLKRTRQDVREMAAILVVSLAPMERLQWCDKCCAWRSSLDEFTGWCPPCTTRHKLELERIADEEEERRLAEAATRETNVVKKARERMRAQYDANPRKGRK